MNDRFLHNVKTFIYFGVLYELMHSCLNPFAIKFLQRIGGTTFDISLYNSMKGVVMVCAVLPGVFYINGQANKKKITSRLVLLMALFMLLFVFIPLVDTSIQPLAFIVISALMMMPMSIYNASYQSFTGEVFPQRRAQVIARRSMYAIIFTTGFTLLSGVVFRFIPQVEADYIRLYQLFFFLAFLLGVGACFVFNKFIYIPIDVADKIKFKASLKMVLRQGAYLRFIIASTSFHFGWQMGWPLFSIYMINTLGADELWLAIINIGSAVVMFVSHRYWPRIIDRFGYMRISTICTLGMAITPVLYAVSPNLIVLSLVSTITGVFISGTVTVLFIDMLAVIPEKNNIIYVGYYNTLTNITLAISPFVGLFFLKVFNIYIALLITTIFRLLGSMAFYLREKYEAKLKVTPL